MRTSLANFFFDDLFSEYQLKASSPEVWEVNEEPAHYKLTVDLPGVKKEALTIDVENGYLTVAGERKKNKFKRQYRLGEFVDPEKIKASYVDGVLEVVLPKAEKMLSRKITISEEPLKLGE